MDSSGIHTLGHLAFPQPSCLQYKKPLSWDRFTISLKVSSHDIYGPDIFNFLGSPLQFRYPRSSVMLSQGLLAENLTLLQIAWVQWLSGKFSSSLHFTLASLRPIKPVPHTWQYVVLLPVWPLGPQLQKPVYFFETDPGDTFAYMLAFEQGTPTSGSLSLDSFKLVFILPVGPFNGWSLSLRIPFPLS